MKRMNRFAALALALLLVLPFLPVPQQAAKANGIQISASVSPASLPGAGTVEVVVTVSNETDAVVENINVSYSGGTIAMGSLDPGESGSVDGPMSVSDDQLGKDLPISVSWVTEGMVGSGSATVNVKKAAPQESAGTPSVDFSRTPSAKSASPGDKITFTYTVKNSSKDTITNVAITDPAAGSNVASGESIKAGESKNFKAEVTVGNTDITSSPKLTYEYDGDDYNKSLDPQIISVAKASLTIKATADKASANKGDSINFTITLTNGGSTNISNIKLVDDAGDVIRSSASVNAGKSPTVNHSITFEQSRNVVFTATYPSGSETATATSEPIAIKIDGEDTPTGEGKLTIVSVEADPKEPELPGNVTFKVTVQNDGDGTLTNIKLSEAKLGQVGTLSELLPGKTHEFSKITKLTEPGDFTFSATASDDSGGEYESGDKSITIEGEVVPTETLTPSMTPEPTPEPARGDGLKTMLIAIVVIVVLIVVAGIALIVLMVQERRAKKLREEEEDPDDDPDDPNPDDKKKQPNKENPQQVAGAPKRRRPPQNGEHRRPPEEGARRRPEDADRRREGERRPEGQPRRRPPQDGEQPRRRVQQPGEDLDSTQVMPPVSGREEPYATREIPVVRERLGDIAENLDDEYEEQPRRARRRPPQEDGYYEEQPRRREEYYEDDYEYEEQPPRRKKPEQQPERPKKRRPEPEDDFNYDPPKRRRKRDE